MEIERSSEKPEQELEIPNLDHHEIYFLNEFLFYLRSKDLTERSLKFIQILFKNAFLPYRKLPEYLLQKQRS
jgi:hypothetical protein